MHLTVFFLKGVFVALLLIIIGYFIAFFLYFLYNVYIKFYKTDYKRERMNT